MDKLADQLVQFVDARWEGGRQGEKAEAEIRAKSTRSSPSRTDGPPPTDHPGPGPRPTLRPGGLFPWPCPSAGPPRPVALAAQQDELVAAVATLSPSVVRIVRTTERRRHHRAGEEIVAGTGFVVDDRGHVVTNYHLVPGRRRPPGDVRRRVGPHGRARGVRPAHRPCAPPRRPEGAGARRVRRLRPAPRGQFALAIGNWLGLPGRRRSRWEWSARSDVPSRGRATSSKGSSRPTRQSIPATAEVARRPRGKVIGADRRSCRSPRESGSPQSPRTSSAMWSMRSSSGAASFDRGSGSKR